MSDDRKRIALIPAARSTRCPACGGIKPLRWVAGRVYCPTCRIGLAIRPAYVASQYLIGEVIAYLVVNAAGIRGYGVLGLVAVAILPTFWLVLFVTVRIFPIDLETTSDFRGVLYGAGADDLPVVQAHDGVSADASAEAVAPAPPGHAPAFAEVAPSRDFEGALLKVGAAGGAIGVAWMSATAVLYRVNPAPIETLSGPRGFEIRAELGENGVRLTNESSNPRKCTIALGFVEHYGAIN